MTVCALFLPCIASTRSFNTSISGTCAGLLLMYLECNRPGRVLPGVVGLLLFLLGLHSLCKLPLRPSAVLAVLIALAILSIPLRHAAAWIWLLTGTALLTLGLARLSAEQAWSVVGAACGFLIGPITAWLAHIARRARRAKRQLTPTADRPGTETLAHGWE